MNDAIDAARAAAHALRQLCRATSARPSMTPAEVADVLADLAVATAALPQVAGQLSAILEQAKRHHALKIDGLTETETPTSPSTSLPPPRRLMRASARPVPVARRRPHRDRPHRHA